MRTVIRKLLREIANGGNVYYHGSVYDTMEWSAAPENVGWATEGYGLYLTVANLIEKL